MKKSFIFMTFLLSNFAHAEIVDLKINVASAAGRDSALAEAFMANASCLSPGAWASGVRKEAKQSALKHAKNEASEQCKALNGNIVNLSKASYDCSCQSRYIHISYKCSAQIVAECEI